MEKFEDQSLEPNHLVYFEKEALMEMERHVWEILLQLKESIQKGEVGTVIGIDGSGRLPALLISKIIKRAYKKLGHQSIQTRFFRGGIFLDKKALDIQLKKYPLDVRRTILIVDDTIMTGGSIRTLTRNLRKRGYKAKVAVQAKDGEYSEELNAEFGHIIYADNKVPAIYGRESLTGVSKNRTDAIHAHPTRRDYSGSMRTSRIQKMIATRTFINEAVDRILEKIGLDSEK